MIGVFRIFMSLKKVKRKEEERTGLGVAVAFIWASYLPLMYLPGPSAYPPHWPSVCHLLSSYGMDNYLSVYLVFREE